MMGINILMLYFSLKNVLTAALTQWVRALVPQAEGWMFDSQLRQTLIVKTGTLLNARQ